MKTCRLIPALLLLWLSIVSLQAQEAPEPATGDAAEEIFQVPPEHASARATMRTFLYAFDQAETEAADSLAVAAACLDLSELPEALRARQGKELAIQLKEILDKTELIKIGAISELPAAPPWQLDVHGHGRVVLAPDGNDEWLFDAATVAAIPTLRDAVRDRETLEGVTRVETLTPAMWLRSKMPESLLERTLVLERWQWLGLLALLIIGLALKRLVATLGRTVAERFLARRLASVEVGPIKRALEPFSLLATALFWWAAVYWLGLPIEVLAVLRLAVHFIFAVSFVWTAYRVVDVIAAVLEDRASKTGHTFDDLLVPLTRKILKVLVIAFGLLFIADSLDLSIGSILASIGIGGLAVALAAQDAVKNLFGSLVVILDRPFSVGDMVKVGNVSGTVEELGFRSTRIRTADDSIVTLPNSNLITSSVNNLGMRRTRRWKTTLGLTYDTPPDKIEAFCEGVRELIREHPATVKQGFQVVFNEFSASSLDVMMLVKFDVPGWGDELAARQQLGLGILRLAESQGVELAFPTQTVHVHGPGVATA